MRIQRSSVEIFCGFCLLLVLPRPILKADAKILDLKHTSRVLGEERHFRIFLPPNYDEKPEKRYPVIYFFHGYGERHNVPTREGAGGYDSGEQYGGDNIAKFVEKNDVIVVKWDGYNPRMEGENYPRPYNIGPVETYRQFPLYFPELVQFIDANYRTLPDREHRAISGLSMGGFMSYWVGGKYPHLVGSVSNFMGSPEFVVGPKELPDEYLHTDVYRNYEGIYTRLVLGSKDFIRWYHWQMNKVWDYTRPHYEHETFDWDHGTPGMSKQLGFHMKAFAHPLPKPGMWHHIDVYPTFEVWGYSVATDRNRPGFTVLENVTPYGFRSSVREWLWDGQWMPSVRLDVTTDSLYIQGKDYEIVDVNLHTRETRFMRQKADSKGRLHVELDGGLHEVGINTVDAFPVLTLAGFSIQNADWAIVGKEVSLKIDLLNKGTGLARNIFAILSSPNPGVTISRNRVGLSQLTSGQILAPETSFLFRVDDLTREIVQFELELKDESKQDRKVPFEVRLFPDVTELQNVQIADGHSFRVQVGGNQTEERSFGIGNGDGIVNPGESFLVLPKDQGEFRLTYLYTTDPYVNPAGLNLRFADYWGKYDHVGGSAKYSMPTVAATCPPGHELVFFAEYWLPSAPEHIIRRGLVRVRVQGKDQTAPKVRWAEISLGNVLELQMIEGGSVKTARAILSRIDQPAFHVEAELNDEGKNGDRSAGDYIFSGTLPYPPAGTYQVIIEAADESGNRGSSTLELHKK